MIAAGRRVAAIEAARAGLRVFPLRPRDKRPLHKGWKSNATSDLAVVEATWREQPDANIGVACGRGLVVIDADSATADAALLAMGMPITPTVKTARGRHYYLTGDNGNRTALLPDVDVRGNGGYVVGAGSFHPSGAEYEWEIAPWELSPAPIPSELVSLLAGAQSVSKASGGSRARELPQKITDGTRNVELHRVASSLRGRFGLGHDEIRAAISEINRLRCEPPLPASEIESIARSAASYKNAPPWVTDPVAFATDPTLNSKARLLLIALARYSDDEGISWPGVRRLRADTGMASDTIKQATDSLVAAGRLAVEKRSRKSNRYRILDRSITPLSSLSFLVWLAFASSLSFASLSPSNTTPTGSSEPDGRTVAGDTT